MSGSPNLHGTAIILGDRGVLIVGRSGAGKTALALSLIERAREKGRFARLVGDDQVFLAAAADRLVVESPPSIRGLVEIRGLGPTVCDSENRAVIDLVVRLVEPLAVPRMQDAGCEVIAGIPVCSLLAPERDIMAAAPPIWAFFAP